MRLIFITSCILLFASIANAQFFNERTIAEDTAYQKLKADIITKFKNASPGQFGAFVKGVDEDIVTDKKILALTFDACGGPHGSGYDEELISFLRKEKIPATLFLSGTWIDAHPDKVKELAADPLFEIENHGLLHRPCTIDGETMYGIHGTANVSQAIDEIELNARKIEIMTSRKPLYFRSATATTDEACAAIARHLDETIISYDLLSGDAVAGTPASVIRENLLRGARHGAIVIMHMNHPEWNGYEALKQALPALQQQGFTFVKLELHPLKGKH
ncbi:MAG TPA: polysaccharide deacetylase family protein [Ohtaekwangia sp.]|uniref:polysaccharide deacetylase family protein n=1 Tax=Ohtaekwangia sp. TaxID=2066019 RepID=UPI002F91C133